MFEAINISIFHLAETATSGAAGTAELTFSIATVTMVLLLGLLAGVLGGMLGVGGSLLMIPGLTLLFGPNQQLYQAAAMLANVAVAVPATLRHHRAKAIRPRVLASMLPAAVACILAGVWLSNQFRGATGELWLRRVFAIMMVYVIVLNVRKLFGERARSADANTTNPDQADHEPIPTANPTQPVNSDGETISTPRGLFVGGAMGTVAGLLGLGGGAVAVPLQQLVMRLPLRHCIANSAAVMCVSAGIGAIAKNMTLADHVDTGPSVHWHTSMMLAGCLIPTCIIGGYLGGAMTHRLPITKVRLVFIALLTVAALRMGQVI